MRWKQHETAGIVGLSVPWRRRRRGNDREQIIYRLSRRFIYRVHTFTCIIIGVRSLTPRRRRAGKNNFCFWPEDVLFLCFFLNTTRVNRLLGYKIYDIRIIILL